MNVTELKEALEEALQRGLHPETEVVLTGQVTDGTYTILEVIEHPLDDSGNADCWFTLTGNGREADSRFTPVHYPEPDPELYKSYQTHIEEIESDADFTYTEFLQDMIDNHEQIWRESARSRDRDSCEKFLQVLRPELEKFQ